MFIAIMVMALLGIFFVAGMLDMTRSQLTEIKTEIKEEPRKMHITSDEEINWGLHCKSTSSEGQTANTAPCFTAEQAILFYNTAPKKWHHTCFSVYYLPTGKWDDKVTLITFPNIEEYVKFMRFLGKQDELAIQKKQIQNTLNLLPYLQADAKHAQEAADQEMANCEEKVRDIYKRIQQERTRSI